jgi:mycothiol synthase
LGISHFTSAYKPNIEELVNTKKYRLAESLDFVQLQAVLNENLKNPHIHIADMPYRLTSTWQDQECQMMVWEKESELLAWAVFQPPWCNLDYAIHPSKAGASLEKEVFTWGKNEMMEYTKRTGREFFGSVEFFENTPKAEQTIANLTALGFKKFDWSIIRFEKDLNQELPAPELPDGFSIRPLRGDEEVESYVKLHQLVFSSKEMTVAWRMRMLKHPSYIPETDLVVVDAANNVVGFCVGWLWREVGQIEPLGIHPAYQGVGLGRALELSALQALRDKGARFIHVDHVSNNEKAIALSLKMGFKQINHAVRYFVETSIVNS